MAAPRQAPLLRPRPPSPRPLLQFLFERNWTIVFVSIGKQGAKHPWKLCFVKINSPASALSSLGAVGGGAGSSGDQGGDQSGDQGRNVDQGGQSDRGDQVILVTKMTKLTIVTKVSQVNCLIV